MAIIDRQELDRCITAACEQYGKSAPTVVTWLEDLYLRLNDSPDSVTITEVYMVERLFEDGQWMHANYAANWVYKLLNRLGRDVSCQAGF